MTSNGRTPRSPRTRTRRGAGGDHSADLGPALRAELDDVVESVGAAAGVGVVTMADANTLHARLRFRTEHHHLPTKIGAALRAVVERHAPSDGGMSHGPGHPVCSGDGFPVTYPCPTTADVAAALEVDLPARSR